MTENIQFVCEACGNDYEGDTSKVMTECRVCRRLHCSNCVDEYGRCIKCVKESRITLIDG